MHAIKAVIMVTAMSAMLTGCTVLPVNVPLGSWVAQKVLHSLGSKPGTSITKPQEPKK
jgi:starvation-inducible outer membrane lipoprotein